MKFLNDRISELRSELGELFLSRNGRSLSLCAQGNELSCCSLVSLVKDAAALIS